MGHNHRGTGQRFLKHLRENDLEDTEQYVLTKEAIEQGQKYYGTMEEVYRENKMVENFIREFDKLEGKRIMGSYGAYKMPIRTFPIIRIKEMGYPIPIIPC